MGKKRTSDRIEKESESELTAKALLERELLLDLNKVEPKFEQQRHSPDYRSADGSYAVEVKEIASQHYRQLANIQIDPSYDSSLLSGRWHIIIMMPTNSTVMEPTPDFPPDNPELDNLARIQFGRGIVPKRQREVEWQADHPWTKKEPARPRLKNLARELERHLAILEKYNTHSTRAVWPADPEAAQAFHYVNARTNSSLCIRHELVDGEKAGIDISYAAGYTRTGSADTLVERIKLWLAHEEYGKNVRDSLAGESNAQKHAVLVFDRETEPEYQSATEHGANFCPSRTIELPEEIDVLWFIIGPIACRYSTQDGWRSMEMP
ncbi:hypothetical protein [Saccharopolyspora sp. NPDC002376]